MIVNKATALYFNEDKNLECAYFLVTNSRKRLKGKCKKNQPIFICGSWTSIGRWL